MIKYAYMCNCEISGLIGWFKFDEIMMTQNDSVCMKAEPVLVNKLMK